MFEELNRWPQKLEDGRELARDFYTREKGKLPTNIKSIGFVGMGGSGIAGRIVKTFLDRRSAIPSYIISSPAIPAYIDASSFVVVMSYSGNTWETVAALGALAERFIPTLVIAHGGRAAAIAEERNLPFILMPESEMPRSALGEFLGILLGLFDRMGIMEGARKIAEFHKQLELYLPKFNEKAYFDKFLAFAQGHDAMHVWGVSGDSAAAAYRATTQLNENTKIQALFAPLPELNHNLLVGFTGGSKAPVVLFSTQFLTPAMEGSLEGLAEVLQKRGVSLYKPPILGDTWEQQVFHIILWADFASAYLAKDAGIDMAPVKIIDELKAVHKAKGLA